MQTKEDLAELRRVFGPAYAVDQSAVRDAESARRAVAIAERDAAVYQSRLPAARRAVIEPVPILLNDQVIAPVARPYEPVVADDLVDAEPVDAWLEPVRSYALSQTQPFSTEDVLVNALHFSADFLERADQMEVSEILTKLGYLKQRTRINGERQVLWAPSPSKTRE